MKKILFISQLLISFRQHMFAIMAMLFVLCAGYKAHAQEIEKCGTPPPTPEQQRAINAFMQSIQQQRIGTFGLTRIPIKAHIIRYDNTGGGITKAEIVAAIKTLNKAYVQANLEFELVNAIHYIDKTQWASKPFNAFGPEKDTLILNNVNDAINIYFIPDPAGLNGLSEFPSGGQLKNQIILRNGVVGNGSTLIHEMGHYWNLRHTHRDIGPGELVTRTLFIRNCNSTFLYNGETMPVTDGLCATPADPQASGTNYTYNAGTKTCTYIGTERDANNDLYTPDLTNFMSYYIQCRNRFLDDQYDVIETGYNTRLSMMNSSGEYNFMVQAAVAAPTNVKVEKTDCETAPRLMWQDNAFNENGYIIERSYNATTNFVAVGRVNAGITTFTDNLPIDKKINSVYYRVVAANANASPSTIVPLLLLKPFIREVNIYNADGDLRYSAEWDKADEKGDTRVTVKKSSPFKLGETIRVEVTTSEKINGMVARHYAISFRPTPDNNTSRSFFVFNIPTAKASKPEEILEFLGDGALGVDCRGNYLFGMKNGIFSANVGPDATGKYPTNNGSDTFHKIKFCDPKTSGLKMAIVVLDARTIRIDASGGTPPYKYQRDKEPKTTNNIFTVSPNGTYNFAATDDNGKGCEVEELYTFISTDCNEVTTAGEQGVDIRQVGLGTTSGVVNVVYDMYSIPDAMTIQFKNANVASTNGLVSGTGTLSFNYTANKNNPNYCIITINAPNAGTAWVYTAYCPVNNSPARVAATQLKKSYTLSYESERVAIMPTIETEKGLFNLRYRYLDKGKSSEWIEVQGIELPYFLATTNKEVQVNLESGNARQGSASAEETVSLKVYPNPSNGPLTVQYFSQTGGRALINVTDEAGRTRFDQSLDLKQGTNVFGIELKQKGIFFVSVQEEGKKSVAKVFIVEK